MVVLALQACEVVHTSSVDVRDIGFVTYHECAQLMKELQVQRINDEISDTLLLVEHEEVVTIGPKARRDGLMPPLDYTTIEVDRGGGLTWHGPGQLVAYPIFKWGGTNETSVKSIIAQIEQWVINALAILNIEGQRDERMQGVWVDGKKICSIGLSFLRWVSRHGFTVNFETPLNRVEDVSGCELGAATTTSLQKLGYAVTRTALMEALIYSMESSISRRPNMGIENVQSETRG